MADGYVTLELALNGNVHVEEFVVFDIGLADVLTGKREEAVYQLIMQLPDETPDDSLITISFDYTGKFRLDGFIVLKTGYKEFFRNQIVSVAGIPELDQGKLQSSWERLYEEKFTPKPLLN